MWVAIAFLVYAIFTSPAQAADMVRAAWDGILEALAAVAKFFDALLAG
jgi:hypothetical protein